MKNFLVYKDPRIIYKEMIKDILNAKKYILLETYKFDDDKTGRSFRDVLIKKAKQGVKIKLLLDAWGGNAKKPFFSDLIEAGAEIRFFREIQYIIRFFSKNHERNHRKLLLIDNKITYIGSMNITSECLNWRELVVRIESDITYDFTKSFYQSWELYGKLTRKRIKKIIHNEYEILQDIPSYYGRATEHRLYKLFSKAKDKILIETPYFVPSPDLIKALARAVKRGVKVILLIPYRSDVMVVDIVANGYLGDLYKKGIGIHYYIGERTMHSKYLIIDNDFFMLGSSNLDYRSLNHNFEINFVGKNKKLIKELNIFFNEGLAESKTFDFKEWKKRSSFWKLLEFLLEMVKEYL